MDVAQWIEESEEVTMSGYRGVHEELMSLRLLENSLMTIVSEEERLKIQGTILGHKMEILIDSGATNNFLSEEKAKCLMLPVKRSGIGSVLLGHRHIDRIKGACQAITLQIQDVKIVEDYLLFGSSKSDFDIVLGQEWLSKLGETWIDWKEKTMSFLHEASWVTISGKMHDGAEKTTPVCKWLLSCKIEMNTQATHHMVLIVGVCNMAEIGEAIIMWWMVHVGITTGMKDGLTVCSHHLEDKLVVRQGSNGAIGDFLVEKRLTNDSCDNDFMIRFGGSLECLNIMAELEAVQSPILEVHPDMILSHLLWELVSGNKEMARVLRELVIKILVGDNLRGEKGRQGELASSLGVRMKESLISKLCGYEVANYTEAGEFKGLKKRMVEKKMGFEREMEALCKRILKKGTLKEDHKQHSRTSCKNHFLSLFPECILAMGQQPCGRDCNLETAKNHENCVGDLVGVLGIQMRGVNDTSCLKMLWSEVYQQVQEGVPWAEVTHWILRIFQVVFHSLRPLEPCLEENSHHLGSNPVVRARLFPSLSP